MSKTGHRYMFQNQEADNEFKGFGNSYNYKYRMHDARLGRFFAVDPISSIYPEVTPYQFALNSVIANKELEGKQGYLASVIDNTYFGLGLTFDLISSASILNRFQANIGLKSTLYSYDGLDLDDEDNYSYMNGAFGTSFSFQSRGAFLFDPFKFKFEIKLGVSISLPFSTFSADFKQNTTKRSISVSSSTASRFEREFKVNHSLTEDGSIKLPKFENPLRNEEMKIFNHKMKAKKLLKEVKNIEKLTKSFSKAPNSYLTFFNEDGVDEVMDLLEYRWNKGLEEASNRTKLLQESSKESIYQGSIEEFKSKSFLEWRNEFNNNSVFGNLSETGSSNMGGTNTVSKGNDNSTDNSGGGKTKSPRFL